LQVHPCSSSDGAKATSLNPPDRELNWSFGLARSDSEEDPTLRAVLVGMLRKADH
jgi:hypothetical protein